jgi:hypothetical protein
MERLEKVVGLLHVSDRTCQEATYPSERPAWLGGLPSFRVWQVSFLLIALIDIGIGLHAWFPAGWVIVGMGTALLPLEGFLLLLWPLVHLSRP